MLVVNKIAIIDDDKITVYLTSIAIKNYNNHIEITTFFDAEFALQTLKMADNLPDIILLDLNMPNFNGWDFLKSFSLLARTCAVYIFTSSIDPEDFLRAKSISIVKGFISKPITKEKLAKLLG